MTMHINAATAINLLRRLTYNITDKKTKNPANMIQPGLINEHIYVPVKKAAAIKAIAFLFIASILKKSHPKYNCYRERTSAHLTIIFRHAFYISFHLLNIFTLFPTFFIPLLCFPAFYYSRRVPGLLHYCISLRLQPTLP